MKQLPANYGILYVDDEEKSLKYFEAIFNEIAPIYTANGPEAGMRVFEQHHDRIGLVLSDKKMPNQSGIEFLKRIREFDPNPLRFLVTAYSDLGVAVDALNDGLLYSYLSKPWDPEEMEHRLIRSLKHYTLMREREQLIEEKAEVFGQLIMADKAASIGILSSGLNHHLRNALTVMRTFHDMLPMQLEEELGASPKDSSFWNEYYSEVGNQIERMTTMLSSLSDGAAASRLKLEAGIDMVSCIQQASRVILDTRGDIEFDLDAESNVPAISGDPQKLSHMMRLLFEESASYLPVGGKIEVQVDSVEGENAVQVRVIGDGRLIPDRDLGRLFDPFFVRSDKPEELGTNLVACYLTVFYHGGRIWAEHTIDNRNSIVFVLPVNPPTERPRLDTRGLFNGESHGGRSVRNLEAMLSA